MKIDDKANHRNNNDSYSQQTSGRFLTQYRLFYINIHDIALQN